MCMFDSDGDGTVTMIHDGSYRKARKAHKCAECRRVIEAGESYHVEAFTFEGDFSWHKTCAHCMVARGWLQGECGGWLYGGVIEDLREHCHEGPYDMGVFRIAVGASWKWRGKRGNLLPVPAMPPTTHDLERAAKEPQP